MLACVCQRWQKKAGSWLSARTPLACDASQRQNEQAHGTKSDEHSKSMDDVCNMHQTTNSNKQNIAAKTAQPHQHNSNKPTITLHMHETSLIKQITPKPSQSPHSHAHISLIDLRPKMCR
jgi:hypothetical protein